MEAIGFGLSVYAAVEKGFRELVSRWRMSRENRATFTLLADRLALVVSEGAIVETLFNKNKDQLDQGAAVILSGRIEKLGVCAEKTKEIWLTLLSIFQKRKRNSLLRKARLITKGYCRADKISRLLNDVSRPIDEALQLIQQFAFHFKQKVSGACAEGTVPCFKQNSSVPLIVPPILPKFPEDEMSSCYYEKRLKKLILARSSSTRVFTAYGSFGLGKSCAIRIIGNDSDVKAHFKDGVYYFEIGKDASDDDVKKNLATIACLAGCDDKEASSIATFPSIWGAATKCAEWFRGRSPLILIDDHCENPPANRLVDLKRIADATNGVCILIATKNGAVANESECIEFCRRSPTGKVARAILMSHARCEGDYSDMPESWNDDLYGILKECAGLPFALGMVGYGICQALKRLSFCKAWHNYYEFLKQAISNEKTAIVAETIVPDEEKVFSLLNMLAKMSESSPRSARPELHLSAQNTQIVEMEEARQLQNL